MGKVFSVLQRKINRFNVENRAQKVITKKTPIPAPKHQSTAKVFEKVKQELSNMPEAVFERDSVLHNKLKEVYVLSADPNVQTQEVDTLRPLPQERRAVEVAEFGFPEPSKIPRGRCSLQQALKFISDHQEDPVRWKSEVVAQEYKLQPASVEKILQHYRMFQVYIPEDKAVKKDAMFVLPSRNKQLAADTEVKQTKLKVPDTLEDK